MPHAVLTRRLVVLAVLLGPAIAASAGHRANLAWSTYFNVNGPTTTWDTAVDVNGDVIITGITDDTNLASNGAYDTEYSGNGDCFVAKFNGADGELLWCTYIGGAGFDEGEGILPLPNGELVVCGNTNFGFTVPEGPNDSYLGQSDVFVVRLSGDGTTLEAGMFVGGSLTDACDERARMAFDNSGSIYLTGFTNSTSAFATTGAAFEQHSGANDAFLAKLDAELQNVLYCTYLGGTLNENGKGVAVDANGNAYVAGMTQSANFPATNGAYDEEHGGEWDAFVAKFSPDGSKLKFATFVGGLERDYAWDIALDSKNKIVITGKTHNSTFPASSGAYDESFNGAVSEDADIYVARLSRDGARLIGCTFLGGESSEIGLGLAIDARGWIWVSGETTSRDFPVTDNAYQRKPRGSEINCFASALNRNLKKLKFSTFLATREGEFEGHIAIGDDGNPVIAGNTNSPNFPTTPGAFQDELIGDQAPFVTKFTTPLKN